MNFHEFTGYLKDYTGVAVALAGTVLALLTYRRASETILQPVKIVIL